MKKAISFIAIAIIAILLAEIMEANRKSNERLKSELNTIQQAVVYAETVNKIYKQEINKDFDVRYIQHFENDIEKYCKELGLSADKVFELAKHYGIDPGYALSRAMLETGRGTSSLWTGYNNPAGIITNGKYARYDDPEEGIEEMFKIMNTYAYTYELVTVDEQSELWSESEDTSEIIEIMKEMEK